MRFARFLAAALLALAPAQAVAQDAIQTSTAPAPTQIRLPLVRLIADGDRVVMRRDFSTP